MMKRLLLLALTSLVLVSCEEPATEYFVRVKVTNPDGIPIQNANVKMFAPVNGSMEWFNTTDSKGEIIFRSGFEAYYDIKAWKLVYEGCNYVRLVKGETTDVNVVLLKIGDPNNGCTN